MIISIVDYIQLAAIGFLLSGVDGKLLDVPQDLAIVQGETAIFNCSTDIKHRSTYWQLVPEGQLTTTTLYNGRKNPEFADRLTVDKYEQGDRIFYNLILNRTTMWDAGIYACQDDGGIGDSKGAALVVLEKEQSCIATNSSAEASVDFLLPNETARIKCQASFRGQLRPAITLGSCLIDSGSIESEVTEDSSRITAEVRAINKEDIECRVGLDFFQPMRGDVANRTITLKIPVHFGVESVKFFAGTGSTSEVDSNNITLAPNSSVTCDADGRPVEIFELTAIRSNATQIIYGNMSIILVDEDYYEVNCTAYNTIRNQKYRATGSLYVTVSKYDEQVVLIRTAAVILGLGAAVVLAVVLLVSLSLYAYSRNHYRKFKLRLLRDRILECCCSKHLEATASQIDSEEVRKKLNNSTREDPEKVCLKFNNLSATEFRCLKLL